MGEIQDGSAVFQILDKRKEKVRQEYVDLVYPVGIVVALANDKKPAFMQYGTWEKVAEDRVLQGASESNAPRKKIEDGLPNITGEVSFASDTGLISKAYNGGTTGCSIKGKNKNISLQGGDNVISYNLGFDASKSNNIYGKSETVQPAAYVVVYWQRTA